MIAFDRLPLVSFYFPNIVTFQDRMPVPFDVLVLIFLNDEVLIVSYPGLRVVLNAGVGIFLRVDEDLFFPFIVFKTNFIKSLSAFARVGLKGRNGFFVR